MEKAHYCEDYLLHPNKSSAAAAAAFPKCLLRRYGIAICQECQASFSSGSSSSTVPVLKIALFKAICTLEDRRNKQELIEV